MTLLRSIAVVSLVFLAACATDPRPVVVSEGLPVSRPPASLPPPPIVPDVGEAPASWRLEAPDAASAARVRDEPRRAVSITFEKAPIATVVDAVLGDTLRLSFRIDPDVQGEVTIRLTGRLTDQQILQMLDQALRASGAAVLAEPGGAYAIVSAQKAPVAIAARGLSSGPEYSGGTAIYVARNVSAAEIVRVLEPLSGDAVDVRADSVREQVFLSGDPTTVNALMRAAALFDVNWMRGRSFQFVTLKYGTPASLVEEVDRILGGKDGPIGSQVELIPVGRLNAVIVAAKSPTLLDEAVGWINRLDRPAPPANRRLRVIPLSNLVAEDFAKMLINLLGSGASAPAAAPSAAVEGAPAPQPAQSNRITADTVSNSIIMFADDAEYQNVLSVVRALDMPAAQVQIEATIAEVTLNDQLKFGVQWFLEANNHLGIGFSSGEDSTAPSSFPGFTIRYADSGFRAVINALSGVTDVELISTPRILVVANQTATLQVGDQVPVITQTATGLEDDSRIVNSVQYRDTGVVLTVTPQVGDQGRIFITIKQEVSEVVGTSSSEIDSPTIQQRRFETRVQVDDGQVIALGGLIRTSRSLGDTGIPFLSDIPVAGALFRSRDDRKRRTELVVFLRARIVRSRTDADLVTNEIAKRMEALGLRREQP